jgi:hypothetical protein
MKVLDQSQPFILPEKHIIMDENILLLMLLQKKKNKLLRKKLMYFLHHYMRTIKERHYLTASALKMPIDSPWFQIYHYGDDLSFVDTTSLTRKSFHFLLEHFRTFYIIPPPSNKGGRERRLKYHHQALGLILAFYTDSCRQKCLCRCFGAPPATISRVLKKAESALSLALRSCDQARIARPSFTNQKNMAELVKHREPPIEFKWGFVDGKNFKVMEPSSTDLQNAY